MPQFIEHDPKILGPFTLKQTVYVGSALGICFLLYFTPLKTNSFFLYVLVCGLIFGGGLALAFWKIQGLAIPIVGKNFAEYSIAAKIFIWKRKEAPVFVSMEKEKKIEKKDDDKKSILKVRQGGSIDQIMKKIDFEK